jgi:hypothetical protein
MKKLVLLGAIVIFGLGGAALAGTRVELKDSETARQQAHLHDLYDHPKTQVVKSDGLNIVITKDSIMRSCCAPPNLVVIGKLTNMSANPINYVRLNFAFEDNQGKVLHAESLFNKKAESMGDDENVQRILNEKPHFDPIQPGQSDTFAFVIPTNMLPEFAKVELFSSENKP